MGGADFEGRALWRSLEADGVGFDVGVGTGFGESPAHGCTQHTTTKALVCVCGAHPSDIFCFTLGGDPPRERNLLGIRLIKLAAFEVCFVAF